MRHKNVNSEKLKLNSRLLSCISLIFILGACSLNPPLSGVHYRHIKLPHSAVEPLLAGSGLIEVDEDSPSHPIPLNLIFDMNGVLIAQFSSYPLEFDESLAKNFRNGVIIPPAEETKPALQPSHAQILTAGIRPEEFQKGRYLWISLLCYSGSNYTCSSNTSSLPSWSQRFPDLKLSIIAISTVDD